MEFLYYKRNNCGSKINKYLRFSLYAYYVIIILREIFRGPCYDCSMPSVYVCSTSSMTYVGTFDNKTLALDISIC